jgi:hypothetical protein
MLYMVQNAEMDEAIGREEYFMELLRSSSSGMVVLTMINN